MTINFRKLISFFTLSVYLFSLPSVSFAGQETAPSFELVEGRAIPVKAVPDEATEPAADSFLPTQEDLESTAFLSNVSPLSRVEVTDEADQNYAYGLERQDFDYAVELLQPGHAAAVIVEDLTVENLGQLLDLPFETGIAVIHGEIVLFSTGNLEEIGVTPAARKLLDEVEFIAHTHAAAGAQAGASSFDLDHAVESPRREFVITGNGVYGYNRDGLLNDGEPYSLDQFLSALSQAKRNSISQDEVAARAALNEFISEMDRYNEAETGDRETYRKSQELLDSITVVINGGAAYTNNPTTTLSLATGLPIPQGEQLQMAFSQDGTNFSAFENFAASKNLALAGADGSKTISIRLRDKDGNLRTVQRSIILDRVAPQLNVEYRTQNIDFDNDINSSNFGASIAKVGSLLAVGASESFDGDERAGSVQLFDASGNLVLLIKNPDPEHVGRFGASLIAIDNNRLIISAPSSGTDGKKAAVYIYDVNPASGTYGQVIGTFFDPRAVNGHRFGSSVEYRNGFLFVGSPRANPIPGLSNVGIVYVFDAKAGSVNFGKQISTIDTPFGSPETKMFGTNLLSYDEGNGNSILFVAANDSDVTAYRIASTGFATKIKTFNCPWSISGFGFGQAMEYKDGRLYIGAPTYGSSGQSGIGRVYVYDGNWQSATFGALLRTIENPEPLSGSRFGSQIRVANSGLVISSPGFGLNVLGNTYLLNSNFSSPSYAQLIQKLPKRTEYLNFGKSLLVDGNDLYVGSPYDSGRNGDLSKYTFAQEGGIQVNNGFVNSPGVTVSLGFLDGFSEVQNLEVGFSQDGINFSSYQAFTNTISLNLSLLGSDGFQNFWVRVKDQAGNTQVFQTNFILDRTAPSWDGINPAIVIENGSAYTNKQSPFVRLSAEDNQTDASRLEVSFSDDNINYSPFVFVENGSQRSTLREYTDSEFGEKTIYVKFRDQAGNISSTFFDTVYYDATAPNASVRINQDASTTATFTNTIAIQASDEGSGVDSMRIQITQAGETVELDWEPYQSTKQITFRPIRGQVSVYVQVKDKAGNIYPYASDVINLYFDDTEGPVTILGPGVYELNLNQDFKNYLSRVMPPNLAATISVDERVNIEAAAMKEYAKQYLADVYDFLVFLPTQPALTDNLPVFSSNYLNQILGLGWGEIDNITGIGTPQSTAQQLARMAPFEALFRQEIGEVMAALRENGKHQGTSILDAQAILSDIDEDKYLDYVLLHELHHRWGTFLSSHGNPDSNPLGILGRDHAHWNMFFDADLSPMDAFNWTDNGNGTFSLTHIQGIKVDDIVAYSKGLRSDLPVSYEFNDFDLYAMGMMDKSAVKSSFVIDNPRMPDGRVLTADNFFSIAFADATFLNGAHTIRGTKRAVGIQDVVNIEGDRLPSAFNSQKDFNVAFIYVKDDSQSSSANDSSDAQNRWKTTADDIWSTATRGLSTLSLGFTSAAFTTFQNKVLALFDAEAGNGTTDSAEVTEAQGYLTQLTAMDTLIGQIEALITGLQAQVNSNSLIPSFIGTAPADVAAIKTQAQSFRTQIQTALNNVSNSTAFISGKRNELLQLILQSAITGLLAAGFGGSVEAIINQIQNLFTGVATANDAFSAVSASLLSQLTAFKTKLEGPVTGHKFDALGNVASQESGDDTFGVFDGSGDSIAVENSDDWNFGTGDFTVDFRLKMGALTSQKYLFQIGGGLYLAWHPVGGGRLDLIAGGSVISANYQNDSNWHHFAVVRNNGVLKLYVDGVQKDLGVTANKSIGGGKFTIGSENSGIMSVNGLFDDFRVTKGKALWTSGFTPPDEVEREAETKLLLNFTAEEFQAKAEVGTSTGPKPVKGTAVIENGKTLTNTASVTLNLTSSGGAPPVQMSFSLDGGTTYSSYEAFAVTKSLTLSGSDGTKEIRVRYKDSANQTLDLTDTIILDRTQPAGTVSINAGAASTSSSSVTLTLDADDALTTDANLQMSVSVDGVSFSAYESFKTTKSVTLTGESGVKTVTVRYKDEAGNIREVTDTIQYDKPAVVFTGKTFTVSGNTAVVSRDSVFGGTSGEWDGAGDYLTVQNSTDWNFGTGDFTVDFRLKMDTLSVPKYLFQIGNDLYLTWHPVGGGRLDLIGAGGVVSMSYPFNTNWHHFAVVRSGGILKLFVDGVQIGAGASATKSITGGKFTIGAESSGILEVDGLFDEFRVSNTARWNSNFTPSTGEYDRDENTKFLLHFTADEFANKTEVGGPKPVAGTAAIANGNAYTTTTSVTVNLTATGGTAPYQMAFSLDGGTTYSSYETYASTKNLTLTGADGNKEVRVRIKDTANQLFDTSDTIILDRAQPTGSVSINAGAVKTTTTNVTLTLDADDAITADANLQMSLSVDGTNFSAYETFSASKNVVLTGANGVNTVTVRYKDQAGNVREVTDSITLETPMNGSAVIAGGQTYSTVASVTLTLTASGGTSPYQMAFSLDGGTTYSAYEAFASTKNLTLTGSDGTKEIRIRYKDAANQIMDLSDTIILDRTQPTGSVSVNGGAAKATAAGVTLTLDADDTLTADANLQMAVSVDGGTVFSAYESFKTSKSVTLPGENGVKTVVVRYKDEAGNVREVTDTIELDKPAAPFIGHEFESKGNIKISEDAGAFGSTAGDLDGSGDYLEVKDSSDWAFGTGDFTVDFRVKLDTFGTQRYLFQIGNGLYLVWHPVGGGRLDLIGPGGGESVNLKPVLGNWNHIAVVRQNGMLKIFVNGTQMGATVSGNKSVSGGKFTIGAENSGILGVDGMFDEFRVSNVARWTGNFTPETGEYVRDENTKLLLHFNEEEFVAKAEVGGSSTPVVKPVTGTAVIAGGSARTNNANVTLDLTATGGTGALEMAFSVDGGSTYSSYESLKATKNLTLSGADGTKEVRVRYRDGNNEVAEVTDTIILDRAQPTGSVSVNAGAAKTTSTGVTLTLDADDALTTDANLQMSVSVDGVNFSAYESFKTSKNVTLVGENGVKTVVVRYKDEAGNIREVTDTIELEKAAAPFVGHEFDAKGNAKASAGAGVFGPAGGDLDGSGDYLEVEDSSDWAFGTGDFTVDFRVKLDTFGTQRYLFQIGNGLYLTWHPVGGGRLDLIGPGGGESVNLKPVLGNWNHIAVVRQNGMLKIFVNGTQMGATVSGNKSMSGGKFTIGAENSGILGVDGMFDEFRVSNVARWTGNFTPETGEYARDANTKLLLHFNEQEFVAGAETD